MSHNVGMYVARIPNRNSPPAILLREGYREGGKVKNRTLANLTRWPPEKVAALEAVLKGTAVSGVPLEEAFEVVRTRPHGHVAAVVGTLRHIGLEGVIDRTPSRMRSLCVGLIAARVFAPSSKLALARGLSPETLTTSLAEVAGISTADADDLYEAMDWLGARQDRIEGRLARRHLEDGTLVLYDVSSAAFEGRTCPIARLGYARDGVKGRLQIVYGVLSTAEGCPVAVEVFEGNTGDPSTLATQINKLRSRFKLSRVILVGDRGMITSARIRCDIATVDGVDYIIALRSPAIKKLVEQEAIQMSLFDDVDFAEITHPDYPGERLVVCKNPAVAAERARKREDLLQATERALDEVAAATQRARRPLTGKDNIGVRVGKVIGRYKVGKHFTWEIEEDNFTYTRNQERIASEAALDGLYVIRTSVSRDHMSASDTVRAYKGLSHAEDAFRYTNMDIELRPIRHHKEDRVKAHLLICMLAWYVEWHMRQALAPILFADDDKTTAETQRKSPVQQAQRSGRAKAKAATKRTADGAPVHSFKTLLADLATVAAQRIQPRDPTIPAFDKTTVPTPLQKRAFDLLGVSHRYGFKKASPTGEC
ncbi:MAG TPA: IS1634 family transposase [Acidimicrobiia bacterium]|nr:IS1634 family transposase [Acidimicrobiia bacterium]